VSKEMSKIQITELQASTSELNVLSDRETGNVVGGHGKGKGKGKGLYKGVLSSLNLTNIVQINNNINIQVAIGGDNYNFSNLGNNAGSSQG